MAPLFATLVLAHALAAALTVAGRRRYARDRLLVPAGACALLAGWAALALTGVVAPSAALATVLTAAALVALPLAAVGCGVFVSPLYAARWRDIEARHRRAEAELRASRERFDRACRGAGVGIWEWNPATNEFWGSALACEQFELVPNADGLLPFDRATERLHPDDRDKVLSAFEAHLTRRVPYKVKYRLVLPSGRARWLESNGQAVWDEHGRPVSVSGSTVDVTDRELLRTEYRLLDYRFTQIAENSPDIYWFDTLDGSGQHYVNPAAAHLTGRSVAELTSSSDAFIGSIHPEDRDRVRQAFAALPQTGRFDAEYRIIHSDGSIRWLHDRGFVVKDGERSIGIAGVAQDISPRKRAESELQDAHTRLIVVLDNVPAWIALTTPDGRVQWSNRAPLSAYRLALADVRDQFLWDGPWLNGLSESQAEVRAVMRRAAAGELVRQDVAVVSPDGEPQVIDAVFAPRCDSSGRVLEIVANAFDVTDRRRIEALLQQTNDRLSEAQAIAGLGWWDVDLATGRATISPELERILGENPGDEPVDPGEVLRRLTHPDDIELVLAAHARALAAPGTNDIEYRVLRADRTVRWVVSRVRSSAGPDGRVNRLSGITFDITARKVAEQEKERHQRMLERIAEAHPDAIYVFDLVEQRNVYQNRELTVILGYTPEQITEFGAEIMPRLVPPDEIERILAHHTACRALGAGEILEIEYRMRHADGTFRILRSRDVAFARAADGTVTQILGVAKDITAQRRAEEQLRKSEERFRAFMDNTPAAAWIADREGRIQFFNPASLRLFDTAGDPTGRTVYEFAPPEYADKYVESNRRVIDSGRAVQVAEPAVRADGTPGEFLVIKFPLPGPDGQTLVAGTAIDITDQRRAEERLRESEERYRFIVENTSDQVFRMGLREPIPLDLPEGEQVDRLFRDLYVAACNDGFVRAYGYDRPEEIVGSSFSDFFPRTPLNEQMQREFVRAGHRTVEARTEELDKHGARKVFLNSIVGRIQDGLVIDYVGSSRDITERVRAEEALRESERRLAQAEELGRIGSWELDARTGSATWSRNMYRLVGREPGHGVYESEQFVEAFVHPDDRPPLIAAWADLADRPVEQAQAFRLCCEDGRTLHIQARLKPIADAGGAVVKWIGTFLDVSEQKRNEQLLASQAAELARSNEELQRFAYVASHDLQEPLRMVRSYLELLRTRYAGHIDEKADKYIRYAVDGAARMKQLIEDLLAYSRVQTRPPVLEAVDLNGILGQVTTDLGPAIADKQADVATDPLPTVTGDRTQLAQVFRNLIGNALKFNDGRPVVRVSVRADGPNWVFSVSDNGIGIAPEHQSRIFQMFQRLHPIGTYGGTGIGLSVCQKVVERHGGRLWVESEPGRGSVFSFSIPVHRKVPT